MDLNAELMLDGNAAAGLLSRIFAAEITVCPAECANCANQAELGALLAFTQAPGIVLRCPACKEVMIRIVQTPRRLYLDVRGTTFIAIPA